MYLLLHAAASGQAAEIWPLDAQGHRYPEGEPSLPPQHHHLFNTAIPWSQLAATVAECEALPLPSFRWVWDSTKHWYPQLLQQNITVARCHDLRLCDAILAGTTTAPDYPEPLLPHPAEPEPLAPQETLVLDSQTSLFDSLEDTPLPPTGAPQLSADFLATILAQQLTAVAHSTQPQKLNLLLAAESAGSLVAAEMQHLGVPWRSDIHDALLTTVLGPQPPQPQQRPEKMEILAQKLRLLLNAPTLNPDSPQNLLRALHLAGIDVKSTSKWELNKHQHPAVEPLLEYKKLARLHSANGWVWLEQWVTAGRFRPEYVVGGVVSGRWASRGGGALQIPQQIRAAAHADAGYKLVVADAEQLEPRVLIAMARDTAMATAAAGHDLYAGIAAQGFGAHNDGSWRSLGDGRSRAKIALLGAIYGSTTGESARLMPQLRKLYPQAVGIVEEAARSGERGKVVSTYLGRSCPPPDDAWRAAQLSTTEAQQRRADSLARTRGRFTRNFVVQGTAAEWACCWLAEIRRRLRTKPELNAELVFFLHDEVLVHCPQEVASEIGVLVSEAAEVAKELIFGKIPVAFPLKVAVVDHYDQAK